MNPRDKFDELDAERQFKSELGAELLGFIDDKREPHEFLLDAEVDEDDVASLDLKTMGLAPFVTRDGEDDEF
jgi:hypothetical protein